MLTPLRSPSRRASADVPDPARVLVVDPHPIIGDAVRSLLSATDDLVFAGFAATASDAQRAIRRTTPHVVLLELSLDDGYGLDLAAQLLILHPRLRIIIYTMYAEQVFAERAIEVGAAGYLMKRADPAELLEGIRRVLRQETYLSASATTRLLNKITRRRTRETAHTLERLTHRELAVLLMLGEGSTPLDIASRLSLDRKTVETHRRRVKEKLGFESISSLLHYATNWRHAQGALEPPAENDV
ncbi:MAG: response regulator transcription factor [Rhodothermales bacterium]